VNALVANSTQKSPGHPRRHRNRTFICRIHKQHDGDGTFLPEIFDPEQHISVRVKKRKSDGNQLECVVSRDTVLTLADGQIVQVPIKSAGRYFGPELLRRMLTSLIRELAARGPLPKVTLSDEGGTFEIEVAREAAE
jgi:hypothetical protein